MKLALWAILEDPIEEVVMKLAIGLQISHVTLGYISNMYDEFVAMRYGLLGARELGVPLIFAKMDSFKMIHLIEKESHHSHFH